MFKCLQLTFYAPNVLFLMETKCATIRLVSWLDASYFSFWDLVPPTTQGGGGLCLAWCDSVKVQVISKHVNYFCVQVTELSGLLWVLFLFYGHPNLQKKGTMSGKK